MKSQARRAGHEFGLSRIAWSTVGPSESPSGNRSETLIPLRSVIPLLPFDDGFAAFEDRGAWRQHRYGNVRTGVRPDLATVAAEPTGT